MAGESAEFIDQQASADRLPLGLAVLMVSTLVILFLMTGSVILPIKARRGRVKRLALERFDGEPVVGSAFKGLLVEAGFRQGPRKLTLSA